MENTKRSFLSKPGVASVVTAFAGVIVLMVIFWLMNPNFVRQNNLMSLARSICPYLLVGIGQGIVCITGNIDLSIGSVLGMSAMISATLVCNGMNVILAIIIDLIACLAVGLCNGLLVGKFKLPPFIGTLGTMTICRGIAQLVNNNYNTGDIGSMDEKSYITITGRLSRFSKISGEMVPDEMVEMHMNEILGAEHRVLAVTGAPDAKRGERLVVVHSLTDLDVDELIDKLRSMGLPNLWIPKREDFHYVERLPLLGSGKLDLQTLKQLAIDLSPAVEQ